MPGGMGILFHYGRDDPASQVIRAPIHGAVRRIHRKAGQSSSLCPAFPEMNKISGRRTDRPSPRSASAASTDRLHAQRVPHPLTRLPLSECRVH